VGWVGEGGDVGKKLVQFSYPKIQDKGCNEDASYVVEMAQYVAKVSGFGEGEGLTGYLIIHILKTDSHPQNPLANRFPEKETLPPQQERKRLKASCNLEGRSRHHGTGLARRSTPPQSRRQQVAH
jgi:hypothetical protein